MGASFLLIHQSAWKSDSRKFNFRFTAFYEVRSKEEGRDFSLENPGPPTLEFSGLG